MSASWLLLVLVLFPICFSILGYYLFWLDKQRAINRGWRISEVTLILIALLGGWPGELISQRHHRHKTRKEPFRTYLNLAAGLHILMFTFLLANYFQSVR